MTELAKIESAPIELSETGILIQQAQERGLDASKLYEIYAEERRDRRKMAFTQAFASFQSEVPPIVKRSKVTVTKGGHQVPYASFEDIRKHVDPYLRKNGFALTYGINDQGYQTVTLMHKDGHSVTQMVPFKPDEPKTQGMSELQKTGSGLSYAKRYATTQVLGLYDVDSDLDGNDPVKAAVITEDQARTVNDLLIEANANRETFLKYFGVASVAELTTAQFDRACTMLNKKIEEARKQ